MHNYNYELLNKFKGTGVALVTPFHEDDTIDFGGLEKLIEHVISGGVEYLVSMGTTGESATLSEEERFSIIDFTLKIANKRVPVVGGFGEIILQRSFVLLKSIQQIKQPTIILMRY